MACLDTDVLVDLAGGSGRAYAVRAIKFVAELRTQGERITTTRLNLAELYVGVDLSDQPRRELKSIQRLVSDMRILEFDDRAARAYGAISSMLQYRGTPIGEMDALIAATAIVNSQSVVTRNAREFQRVPGLVLRTF